MSEILHEQLSALIDGELPTAETALLMKRLEREPELRARLARYHACGATLRGGGVRVRSDFSLRVSAVLADEPCHGATLTSATHGARPRRRFLKPLAGLAVAASVATAALLVIQRPTEAPAPTAQLAGTEAPARMIATTAAPAQIAARQAPGIAPRPLSPNQLASTEPRSYVTPPAEVGVIPRRELANYALAHSGVVGAFGVHSVYTSLVTDDEAAGTPAR